MNKDLLRTFADNELLVQAVREVIEDKFFVDALSTEDTNEFLGQRVRARIEGLAKLDEAFTEIASFKTTPSSPKGSNPGR